MLKKLEHFLVKKKSSLFDSGFLEFWIFVTPYVIKYYVSNLIFKPFWSI